MSSTARNYLLEAARRRRDRALGRVACRHGGQPIRIVGAARLMRSELCAQARALVGRWVDGTLSGPAALMLLLCVLEQTSPSALSSAKPAGDQRETELEAMGLALGLPRGVLSRAAEGGFLQAELFSKPPESVVAETLEMLAREAMVGRAADDSGDDDDDRAPLEISAEQINLVFARLGMTHRRHGNGTAGSGGEAVDHPEDHFVRVQVLLELVHRHSGIADGADDDGDENDDDGGGGNDIDGAMAHKHALICDHLGRSSQETAEVAASMPYRQVERLGNTMRGYTDVVTRVRSSLERELMGLRDSRACALLGIDAAALHSLSDSAISRAYRKASLRAHPDRGGDAVQFQKLRGAYEHVRKRRKSTRSAPSDHDRSSTREGASADDAEECEGDGLAADDEEPVDENLGGDDDPQPDAPEPDAEPESTTAPEPEPHRTTTEPTEPESTEAEPSATEAPAAEDTAAEAAAVASAAFEPTAAELAADELADDDEANADLVARTLAELSDHAAAARAAAAATAPLAQLVHQWGQLVDRISKLSLPTDRSLPPLVDEGASQLARNALAHDTAHQAHDQIALPARRTATRANAAALCAEALLVEAKRCCGASVDEGALPFFARAIDADGQRTRKAIDEALSTAAETTEAATAAMRAGPPLALAIAELEERARDVRMLRSINSCGLADCATDSAALLIRALAAEVRACSAPREALLACFP